MTSQIKIARVFKNFDTESLTQIGQSLNVDYRTRALAGNVFLKLLILGNLLSTENSQHKLSSIYSSEIFRKLVDDSLPKSVAHQSISRRLKAVPSQYFKRVYEAKLQDYNKLLKPLTYDGYNIYAVDSSMVSEVANKLVEGMSTGRKGSSADARRKKQVKYTMLYDGIAALEARLHTSPGYLDEDRPLSEAIYSGLKTVDKKKSVFCFDRGIKSNIILSDFAGEDIRFVGRFNNKRRVYVSAESAAPVGALPDDCELVSDQIAQLYSPKTNNLLPNKLRIVEVKMPHPIGARHGLDNGEKTLKLVTDEFDLPVADLMEIYRLRWTIEVFFKFLKSNLNFGHFLSVDKNGMESMLWITLLTALLVKVVVETVHLRKNNAVFQMRLKLTDMILADAEKINQAPSEHHTPTESSKKHRKSSSCH